MPLRLVTLLSLAVLAVASSATASSPGLVHRGQAATISFLTAKPSASCSLSIRYANGLLQKAPARHAVKRHVTFTVTVDVKAPLGLAQWTARCGTQTRAGSFVVLDTVSTTAAPRVVVGKEGFSQRPNKYDTGSAFSYGLILQNTSPDEDAQNVYVIVNMVDASGQLLATKTRNVSLIPAGASFAFGDNMSLRTQVAVDHLELTIRVGAHAPAKPDPMPDFANVGIFQASYDPGFVGEVDGEIVNATSKQTLTSANLSVVLLDAAGNPIGGGTGNTFSPIPSGSRIVFLVQSGFSAVPIDKAATALVSVEPTYQTS